MSSNSRVKTYSVKASPSRTSSSSSSYSPTKDQRHSHPHSCTPHRNSSRDSISSTPRYLQSDDDVVIVVMGISGSGKSTFINLVADEKVEVGRSLESCTTAVQLASFATRSGRHGYLIDTPGFDDTHRSDTEILKEIAAFLTKPYMRNVRVTGLVYVHRITDPRMQGSAVKNLKVFQKLCGAQCFPQVALVSTMWQELRGAGAQALGEQREAELRNNMAFWGAMAKAGSRTFRHVRERESTEAVTHWFFNFRHKVVLTIQRELVDDELTLDQTAAGKFLQEMSGGIKAEYEKEIRQLQTAIDDAHHERDLQTENELLLQRTDVETNLERVDRDSRNMRVNVRQIEAEKAPEFALRVEEMERERDLMANTNVSALQARLKELQDERDSLERDHQQREKELLQRADAIRRQDSAKAQDQIARLEARSRNMEDTYEEIMARLQAEGPSPNGASRVLEFMMRFFAPSFRSGPGPSQFVRRKN